MSRWIKQSSGPNRHERRATERFRVREHRRIVKLLARIIGRSIERWGKAMKARVAEGWG
jgi:hypothetical protein